MKLITSSVAFQSPSGVVAANGYLMLTLQQNATIIGGGQIFSTIPTRIKLDSSGKIPAGTQIVASDEMVTQIPYTADLQDSNMSRLDTLGTWAIVGASPIDLSLMVSTNAGVSFPGAVLLSPSGDQTILNNNLLPASGNTTQSLGSSSAQWDAALQDVTIKNLAGIRYADQFANVQAAITDLPSSGGIVDARSANTNLALGTIDVGSDTKPVTLLLGPWAYTADHIVMRANFEIIGSAPTNVSSSATRITSVGLNTQPLIVNATSGLIAVYGAGLENMTLIGLSGNTTQKGLFFDVSANTTLSVIDHFRLSRVAFSGFKGSNIHCKGSINVGTLACFIQFFKLEHVTAVRPSSGAECLRCEGAAGQFDYYSCQFDGPTKGDGNNIYIGGTSNSDVTFPYSHNFFGLTSQNAATCFTGDGFFNVNFYGSHHENLNGVYLLQSSFTNSRNNQGVFSGAYFANAGINAGNGYILKTTTTNVFGAILEKSSIASVPDKLVVGTNLNVITVRDNGFAANLASANVTTAIDALMNPAATLNLGTYHTVALQASGTSITTLVSQLGPGEIITFFANGTCQFATGGNITLPGRVSPLVIVSGENATFENSDYSGTNTWRLLSVNTATLTGQTLTSAGNGNTVTLLNSQDAAGNITGNGTDQTVFTYTIPANTIQAGKGFRLRLAVQSNNAVNCLFKIILGTTTLYSFTSTTASTITTDTSIMNNAGVQNAQAGIVYSYEGATAIPLGTGTFTSAENLANSLALKITANEANPNTVTPKKWIVDIIQ